MLKYERNVVANQLKSTLFSCLEFNIIRKFLFWVLLVIVCTTVYFATYVQNPNCSELL